MQEGPKGQYTFNPIQAAVAQEPFGIVELLLKYGAEMPALIAVTLSRACKKRKGGRRG